MDLRIERTRRSIINAFIELRATKPLEKITVKELSELALINKATFYSHFTDIYDLSEYLEKETIENILKNIPHPDNLITNPKQAVSELALALMSQESLVNILFSDSRASILASRLEDELKSKIYSLYPEYKNNLEWNVLLTVIIQGNFHAFLTYSKNSDTNKLVDIIGNLSEKILSH